MCWEATVGSNPALFRHSFKYTIEIAIPYVLPLICYYWDRILRGRRRCPPLACIPRGENPNGVWRYRRIKNGRGVRLAISLDHSLLGHSLTGSRFGRLSPLRPSKRPKKAGQLAAALYAQSKGLTAAEAESITNANRLPMRLLINNYLEQKSGKARKTDRPIPPDPQ